MHTANTWGLGLTTNAAGAPVFGEVNAGTLLGIPVVASLTVPDDVVFLIERPDPPPAARAAARPRARRPLDRRSPRDPGDAMRPSWPSPVARRSS